MHFFPAGLFIYDYMCAFVRGKEQRKIVANGWAGPLRQRYARCFNGGKESVKTLMQRLSHRAIATCASHENYMCECVISNRNGFRRYKHYIRVYPAAGVGAIATFPVRVNDVTWRSYEMGPFGLLNKKSPLIFLGWIIFAKRCI